MFLRVRQHRGSQQPCAYLFYLFGRREIKASSFVEFGPMVSILVKHCTSNERLNRLTAVEWVHEFIKLGVRLCAVFPCCPLLVGCPASISARTAFVFTKSVLIRGSAALTKGLRSLSPLLVQ